ncbi:MAG: hypothetical protein EOP83_05955 [Verrucomicrobiaceae bacterium]|nr:MAG: hypothetical protein EOP83_05955 [Verrucomicrobiaceae bacterium]
MTWQVVGKKEVTPEALKEDLMDQLRPIVKLYREQGEEEVLRKKFPALQSAYDNYRMILEICRSNNPDLPTEANEGASR